MNGYGEARRFTEHEVARVFAVPDHLVGLPSPWWRRWLQTHITRRLDDRPLWRSALLVLGYVAALAIVGFASFVFVLVVLIANGAS